MDTTSLFDVLIIGGLMGAVGQGIRTAPGLKKAYDDAADNQQTLRERFEASRLVVSLFIGFLIGVLMVLALNGYAAIANFYGIWGSTGATDDDKQKALTQVGELLLGLAAAGYAGTDFVEGLIKRRLPVPSKGEVTPKLPDRAPNAPSAGM